MKEHPILFTGEMVRAILEVRKTQTRRVVSTTIQLEHKCNHAIKFFTEKGHNLWACSHCGFGIQYNGSGFRCPYGMIGDRLWVRETWVPCYHGSYEPFPKDKKAPNSIYESALVYQADGYKNDDAYSGKWRPSIHMPRWASRITLEVTDVRVQRLQVISEEDAIAEGTPSAPGLTMGGNIGLGTATYWYKKLWDMINAKRGYGWDKNPWVWAITFKQVKP